VHPYAYANVNFPRPVTWTFGISYDDLDASLISVKEVNPKIGMQLNITDDVLLRAAYFQFVKPVLANNQTLEPTQVAGFNQVFDDTNGARSKRWGVGLDWSPLDNLFVGGEATWRYIDLYSIFVGAGQKFDLNEQTHRVYMNWLPIPELALSAEFVYDRFQTSDSNLTLRTDFPEKVETYSVPLGVRYFHPSGAFAGVGVTYVNQDVKRSDNQQFGLGGGNDNFFYVDTSIEYRLPKRFGIISFGVTNLLDTAFHYQDDGFREFQDLPSVGPYFPERLFFGRITLNW
jgi:hypothetical protein